MKIDLVASGARAARVRLENALSTRGLDAKVYGIVVINDGYAEIVGAQQLEVDCSPRAEFKLFLNLPITGLNFNRWQISVVDKVESEFTITCLIELLAKDTVFITMPDGRLLKLKVKYAMTDHAYSTFSYNYKAVPALD